MDNADMTREQLLAELAELRDVVVAAALFLQDGMGVAAEEHVALLAGNSVAYVALSIGAM